MSINKYKFLDKLSSGSFGFVYKGIHERTNEFVAIKVEPRNSETNSLKHEAKIYQFLAGIKGIPSLKWFGFDKNCTYLVLPFFEESLKNRKESLKKISLQDVCILMNSVLLILREIHNHSMVHCDIKPENIMIKNNNLNMIYLIDFGLTSRYSPENKKTNSSIGTVDYMSRRVHEKYQPSYVDDIESLFYVSLFLYYKSIPWIEQHNPIAVKSQKQSIFLNTRNLPVFFQKFSLLLNSPLIETNMNLWYEKLFTLFQSGQK